MYDSRLTTLTDNDVAGFLCIIYTYFRVPEPRGRSFAELDLLFERKVSARNFASTRVDVFDDSMSESAISTYEAKGQGVVAEKDLRDEASK